MQNMQNMHNTNTGPTFKNYWWFGNFITLQTDDIIYAVESLNRATDAWNATLICSNLYINI